MPRNVGQSELGFNFRANCGLFEACTYRVVTLEMVHLIPVTVSPVPAALWLPPAPCEIALSPTKGICIKCATKLAPGVLDF